jgi:hypothetical protein
MVSAFFTGTVISNFSASEPNLERFGPGTDEFLGTITAAGIPTQHALQHRPSLGPVMRSASLYAHQPNGR